MTKTCEMLDFIELAASGNTDPDRVSEIAAALLAKSAGNSQPGPDSSSSGNWADLEHLQSIARRATALLDELFDKLGAVNGQVEYRARISAILSEYTKVAGE